MTDAAREDLAAIVGYLAGELASPQAAETFLDAFEAFLDAVGRLPESHPLSQDERLASLGYRKALVRHHVAPYRVGDGVVYVAHLFHASQDYARLV